MNGETYLRLKINGLSVSVGEKVLAVLVRERLLSAPAMQDRRVLTPPCIGEVWSGQGGVYSGVVRGVDGGPDCYLISGPAAPKLMTWDEAMAWAPELVVDGHKDFELPRLAYQSVSRGNTPELFEPQFYWSCEQRGSGSGYACGQYFSGGYQSYWGKGLSRRARAVRRLPI